MIVILISLLSFHLIYSLANWKFKYVQFSFHFTSLIFSIAATLASLYLNTITLNDKLLDSTPTHTMIFSVATGYFLWDTLMCLTSDQGSLFIFHGIACLLSFGMAVGLSFALGYGKDLLIFEMSTIFLNIHWFCDKLNLSGSRIQFINGIMLLSSFFIVRVIYGTLVVLEAIADLQRNEIDSRLRYFYSIAGIGLSVLNYYWFYAMVKSVRSRFTGKRKQ